VYNLDDINQVHLEITGRCNAKCPMCSRHAKDGEIQPLLKQTDLSEEAFYNFFTDDFCYQLDHVYMSGVYGDPCMHPKLFEFCKHLTDKGIDVALETNGGYRKPEFWKKLASTNVLVRFAVDGLEDTNHLYRRNVRWDVLEKNMRAYSEGGGRAEWNFIVFEHNEHQVDDARMLANQLNFDFRVKVTQKFRAAKTWHVLEDSKKINELKPPQNEEYRHPVISNKEYDPVAHHKFDLTTDKWKHLNDVEIDCKALQRNELFLSYQGYVLPCCYVGTLYNDSPASYQLRHTLQLDKYDITKNSLETVLDNMNEIKDSWSKSSVKDGKLMMCAQTCKKNNQISTQFITEPSKSFCILPWIHAQTKPNGQIKPCCRFDHRHEDYREEHGWKWDRFNINKGMTFKEAVESPEWQEIRDAMLKNKDVPGCRKCYAEQTRNLENKKRARSMRVKENWFWNKNNQFEVEHPNELGKLRYIELALGNYCNLKCRTCTADLSSTWEAEENILSKYYEDRYTYPTQHVEQNWKIEDFEYVEEIKFTGGEPMLHPNFIKVIDLILQTGRAHLVNLDIFTNASWVPKEKVLSRLRQFRSVKINLSIDGIGKVNDYVRAPSKWDVVESSVKTWIAEEAKYEDIFVIKWAPCISLYNVWQFTEMVEWWTNLQIEFKGKGFWDSITRDNILPTDRVKQLNMIVNIVHDPKYLAPTLYPEKEALIKKILEQKDRFYDKLVKEFNGTEHEEWVISMHFDSIYDKIVSTVKKDIDKDMLQKFAEYTADLDMLRSQSIQQEIPEVWNVVKDMVVYKGRINEPV
jgi:MoaA/NifB/PqqE/SkfB family radical SAM enzyme